MPYICVIEYMKMASSGLNPSSINGMKYRYLYTGIRTDDLNPVERLNSVDEWCVTCTAQKIRTP